MSYRAVPCASKGEALVRRLRLAQVDPTSGSTAPFCHPSCPVILLPPSQTSTYERLVDAISPRLALSCYFELRYPGPRSLGRVLSLPTHSSPLTFNHVCGTLRQSTIYRLAKSFNPDAALSLLRCQMRHDGAASNAMKPFCDNLLPPVGHPPVLSE